MTYLVQDYFSHSATKFPHKIAVCCDGESRTFTELEEFTNSFARSLQAKGIKKQHLIPFFLKKSVRSIQALLSILKADCAYVPIDINSPAQRLESILLSADARVLIVDDASLPVAQNLLKNTKNIEFINISEHEVENSNPIKYQNLSIDLAYVLFTSGSTGVPKGVMIPHKAIIDYIDWCVDAFELTDKDVIANHAPLYFDNSTFDLYTSFKTGSTLHLVHDELNSVLPALVNWIENNEISTFFCVPSVLTLLMQSRRLKEGKFQKLRHLICAGEALPPKSLKFWMERYPHIQYTNMYGPTEITVDCSYYFINQIPDENTQSIPIGEARRNMELFVRQENGALSQSKGTRGELLVRGTSVAYGYLGDKVKTEGSFIQNPHHNLYHDLLYCTGDLVEIDSDGNYHYIGRADDQIKFLGYRIELGEIEASLTTIEFVDEGVVVVNRHKETTEVIELGALLKMDESYRPALIEQLKSRLPNYMVPTTIVVFEGEFPRTPNGKYSRKDICQLVFGT